MSFPIPSNRRRALVRRMLLTLAYMSALSGQYAREMARANAQMGAMLEELRKNGEDERNGNKDDGR